MMSTFNILLTALDKMRLEAELHSLRAVCQAEIQMSAHNKQSSGNPLDNGEYQAACLAQAILRGRIAEMEAILIHARVIGVHPETNTADWPGESSLFSPNETDMAPNTQPENDGKVFS